MKTKYKLAIALVAGAALGGGAIQQMHTQMKPLLTSSLPFGK
jgi:hypothetical protein